MGLCYGYRMGICCGVQVTDCQFHKDWGHEVGSKGSTMTLVAREHRRSGVYRAEIFTWALVSLLFWDGISLCCPGWPWHPWLRWQSQCWDRDGTLCSAYLSYWNKLTSSKVWKSKLHTAIRPCALWLCFVCSPITLSKAIRKDSLNMAQSTNSVYLGTQWKVAKKLLIFMSHSQTGPQLSNILSVPLFFIFIFFSWENLKKCMLVKDTHTEKPNPWLHPHCK